MQRGCFALAQSKVTNYFRRHQQKLLQSYAFTSQGFVEMYSWVWFMGAQFSDFHFEFGNQRHFEILGQTH